MFETRPLPDEPDVIALDGSEVRVLLTTAAASTAHFQLPAGETSRAVTHPEIEEIWHFVGGSGEFWRERDGAEETIGVSRGMTISIPPRTRFQFRATGDEPLAAFGVTMPPWPADPEAAAKACRIVVGKWEPTVS